MQEFPLPRLFERGSLWTIITTYMEQTNILERTTPLDELEFVPAETNNALNVVSVYQDAPTRKWANQVCDQVTRLAGEDAVHCTQWEISRLGDLEVLKDATLMTMVADVILVSIYDAKKIFRLISACGLTRGCRAVS